MSTLPLLAGPSADVWTAVAAYLSLPISAAAVVSTVLMGRRASRIASEANDLAARSASAAAASADEARRANAIADDANQRAARAEALSSERAHVVWERSVSRKVLTYRNVGVDPAHNVRLHIDSMATGHSMPDVVLPVVEAGTPIGGDIGVIRHAVREDWQSRMTATIPETQEMPIRVRATLTWESALGTEAVMQEALHLRNDVASVLEG